MPEPGVKVTAPSGRESRSHSTRANGKRVRLSQGERGSAAAGEQPVAAFFVPNDAIVPAQYFTRVERRSALSPEKKLLWAVLESAVHDVQMYHRATRTREQRLFREAWDWFTTREATAGLSFERVCHALGLDPEWVCWKLSRWLVDPEETERDMEEATVQSS